MSNQPSLFKTLLRGLGNLCRWIGLAILRFVQLLIIGWAALAIFYSPIPWPWLRLTLALVFAAFGIWMLWISRKPRSLLIFSLVFLAILVGWLSIKPTNDHPWRPEVAVMPRATINGDTVRFTGVRDFEYRSRDDFTVRYITREVSISHLTGVDFYVSYWKKGPVGHTFLSFIFDNAPPLSVSIETRPVVGQGFDPIASLFKQFNLIYVVGEERDIVGVRTNYRGEKVFLYHLNISKQNARKLFLVYIKRINELANQAEFYNLIRSSCTINIIRYANAAGREGGFNIRHYLNGFIDSYLYTAGWINNNLDFYDLRRRSFINPQAEVADKKADFPAQIRVGLPPAQ